MGINISNSELITLNFNLRNKRLNQSPIYAVIRVGNKQYKLATCMKICPMFWDSSKQVVKLNSCLNDKTIEEYVAINNKLSSIYNNFMTSYQAIQNSRNEDELKLVFKEIIALDYTEEITTSKNVIKATTLVKRFLDSNREKTSENTMKMYDSQMKSYLEYIKEKNLSDNAKLLFQQVQINAYKNYLINKGESVSNINGKVGLLVRCVNYIVNTSTTNYGIIPVTFKREIDKRSKKENSKHFVLTPEELEKIANVEGLTYRQKLYRNIMLMQYSFGQRESDMTTLLKGDYKILNGNIILKTIKEKTTSIIPLKLCEGGITLLKKWEKNKDNIEIVRNLKNFRILYGLMIKKIAKKAGLDRKYTYINAKHQEERWR
jgi:site-specific recombinase XerD